MIFSSLPIRERERGQRISGMPILGGWRTAIIAMPIIVCLCSARANAQTNSPHLAGVSSCTAAGCHGAANTKRSVVGSEYNLWVAQDPHARAYSILFEKRSQEMERLLNRSRSEPPKAAHEDPRCLACHATTDSSAPELNLDIASDGVSCESCHGPASTWLSTHYERKPDAARRREIGMEETKDLYVRAQICTRCHVGGPAKGSNPKRDVNHDLIAAGHPRLQFEMSAYHQAMPKHWSTKGTIESEDKFETLLWAVGQVCSSQAAVEQLASRASTQKTWPEFAEWNCSACHHELRDDATRQGSLASANKLPGQLVDWDVWNHFMIGSHADDICTAFGVNPKYGRAAKLPMQQLADEMRKLNPDRDLIGRLVNGSPNGAKIALNDLAAEIMKSRTPPRVNYLTQSLLKKKGDRGIVDWSRAAQTYDALACFHETRLRQEKVSPQQAANHPITDLLQQLYGNLAKPVPPLRNSQLLGDGVLRQFSELSEIAPAPEINE